LAHFSSLYFGRIPAKKTMEFYAQLESQDCRPKVGIGGPGK